MNLDTFRHPSTPLSAVLSTLASVRRRKERPLDGDLMERYYSALGLDVLIATELAQFHTFAIPSISSLLARTGQYEEPGTRRIDDTKTLLLAPLYEGTDSENGVAAIAQVNRIHDQYKISNDDFLYVLSTFIFVAESFTERYSWRVTAPEEEETMYMRVVNLGRAMNIADVPLDIEEFRAWKDDYLVRNRTYHPDNHAVAEAMMRSVEAAVPKFARPLVSPISRILMDDGNLLETLGYKLPPAPLVAAVRGAFAMRKRTSRHISSLNKRNFVELYMVQSTPSRPQGFDRFSDLGPAPLRKKFARQDDEERLVMASRRSANSAASGPGA